MTAIKRNDQDRLELERLLGVELQDWQWIHIRNVVGSSEGPSATVELETVWDDTWTQSPERPMRRTLHRWIGSIPMSRKAPSWTDAFAVLVCMVIGLSLLFLEHGWKTALAMVLIAGSIGRPWRG